MVEVGGAHRLSPAEREVLRLRVVVALESGRVEGCRQAAETFGVSERSVGTWWRAHRREGRDGLAIRRGRSGPAGLISAQDRGTLFAAMADHASEKLPIGGPLWTRQAVVELIGLDVGVNMTGQGVGLWLRRHGFTRSAGPDAVPAENSVHAGRGRAKPKTSKRSQHGCPPPWHLPAQHADRLCRSDWPTSA